QSVENNQHLMIHFQLPFNQKEHERDMYARLEQFLSAYDKSNLIEKYSIKVNNVTRKAVHYKLRLFLLTTTQNERSQIKSDVLSAILWNHPTPQNKMDSVQ